MNIVKRVEVYPNPPQNMEQIVSSSKHYLGLKLNKLFKAKLYLLELAETPHDDEVSNLAQTIFTDEVTEYFLTDTNPENLDYNLVLEIKFKPGVTDNPAHAAMDAISIYNPNLAKKMSIYTGFLYFIQGDLTKDEAIKLGKDLLGNDLLNSFEVYLKDEFTSKRFENNKIPKVHMERQAVKEIDLSLPIAQLKELSDKSCWALSTQELEQVIQYYQRQDVQHRRAELGLPKNPTDVEIEIIAQSWSEHCKHKIFAANISYDEFVTSGHKIGSKRIQSLYKTYIKKATNDIKSKRKLDWLISVFTDNAGIVRFDPKLDLCIKVETHNSPSALDPYGGALTGILGVNRDILGCGIGAKPVANTDVFCFAHESMIENGVKLPSGLKHPKRILDGVHQGVEDGGNKSGIPTVNGSIFYDDDYAGKPLVYVGTVGVMPQQTQHYPSSAQKEQGQGDLVVMVGGRIGADGIHGATFSSLELDENSPATAVQIGDPLTQKKALDFLIAARDQGLYTSVTDNGAGGLSSSVGEMAEKAGGVELDLAKAPVKYPGLSPYELMISESQERMTFAVSPKKIDAFLTLASDFGVEATVLGEFNQSGFLTVKYDGAIVGELEMHFLHESLIPMELAASLEDIQNPYQQSKWHLKKFLKERQETASEIKILLARPNIQSKEKLVRRYDHEVQAATVVKPFMGKNSGPSDAGVIWLAPHGGDEKNAVAISNGLAPLHSHLDAYEMAQLSVDEAVRNAVATGADPDQMVLLDNFCWPDPVVSTNNPDGKHKMAQLVRACEALYDVTTTYGMPFVSGKDSMKNDYRGVDANGNPVKISVPPTVLITCMGRIPDVEKVMTTDFKNVGDLIYLIGPNYEKLDYCEYTRTFDEEFEVFTPTFDAKENLDRYRRIYQASKLSLLESCHDISEGGAITAILESAFGEGLGVNLKFDDELDFRTQLFSEGNARFIVSVNPKNRAAFEKAFHDSTFLGEVTSSPEVIIKHKEEKLTMPLSELYQSWLHGGEV